MNTIRLATVFVLMIPAVLLSSNHDFVVERFTHPDLIPAHIASVTQDSTGFLWFATSDGLYRYDGIRFEVYKSEVRNPASLPNNNIRAVFTDDRGRLWVLPQGGGLSLFNPTRGDFTNFVPDGDHPESVTGTYDFRSIQQSGEHLVISSHGGDAYFEFNLNTLDFTRKSLPATRERHFIQSSVVLRARDGSDWVGTDQSGLIHIRTDGSYRRFSPDQNNLNTDRVSALMESSDGTIWIGTVQAGLLRMAPGEPGPRRIRALDRLNGFSRSTIYAIQQDERGNIWIGSNLGIVIYDPSGGELVLHFQFNPSTIRSLSSNEVRSIFTDSNGIVWVGTRNAGLNKLKIRGAFENILTAEFDRDGELSRGFVRAIHLSDDELWIGTEGGGIHILDSDNYALIRSIDTQSRYPSGLQSNEITSFTPDPDGGLWIGTWGGGLHYYHPDSPDLMVYRYEAANSQSLSDDRIQFVHIDSRGQYWVGTENGLNRFDRDTGVFQRIKSEPDDTGTLAGNSLQTLGFLEKSPGIFWVASWQGLSLYDADSNRATRYLSDPVDLNTLSSNHVISLYDDGNYLWIGTFGGGLNRLDPASGRIKYYTEQTGLPNNVIFAILPDQDGNLWLSSSSGLFRFNPEDESLVNYTESDGLQGNDFWWGSAFRDAQGVLYFGGTNGLTSFNPRNITRNDYEPRVVISGLSVENETFPVADADQPVQISAGRGFITIEFASLDFSDPDKNQYAYRIAGLSTDWTYIGNRSSVSYASLPPGTHYFEVKATNSAGVWSPNQASITLVMEPFFYQTNWFWILTAILGLSTVALLFVNWSRVSRQRQAELERLVARRTRDLAEKSEELLKSYAELRGQTVKLQAKNAKVAEQNAIILAKSKQLEHINKQLVSLNHEKNSLIGIVAHDLRSPATSVLSALQLLQLQPELNREEQEELYTTMEDILRKQLAMVNRILDHQSLESGIIEVKKQRVDLVKFCRSMAESYREKAAVKGIVVEFVTEGLHPEIDTDEALLEQILDNLLSNAVKFSPADQRVHLILNSSDYHVHIGVRDRGPGLTESDKTKLFGKFQRLSAKPTAGEQTTGLGLSIVKRLADALGAAVRCESEPGQGATFWIDLPAGLAAE
ncbi:MAG: Signal transduction histidine kinase [Bacteroidetes bacterium HLUCCA01]|nr:MAG: Signal transduction histidine kinase [Bacteroidetes bacterium HLUCCA01]